MQNIIESIDRFDKVLLVWVHRNHSPILDKLFWALSDFKFWVPLIVVIILSYFKKFSHKPALIYFLSNVLAVILSDMLCSRFMKPYFGRLRPCHQEEINASLHMISPCPGLYSFASSHASTAMSMVFFFILVLKPNKIYSALLIFWSILVAYSRMYLGVHFFTDVLVGALIGMFFSLVLNKFLYLRFNQTFNQ
jgi:undecaprenyl-diphosphatase